MTQTSTDANTYNVTYESVFQVDIVTQMEAQGWPLHKILEGLISTSDCTTAFAYTLSTTTLQSNFLKNL